MHRLIRPLSNLGLASASSASTSLLSRAFHATPPLLLAWANKNQQHAPPVKWRWTPEPGQEAGTPHTGLRAAPRAPGQKSHNQKLDEQRIARGEKPRRLIKTRKRIAHARHTHIARFRLRKGPAPRAAPVWEDPEQATRDAMMQFIDPYELDPDLPEPGRQWRAAELRLKSNEDLQRLWVVLLKERNMLHTTRLHHRKQKTSMPHRSRLTSVRKSMGLIRLVLDERQKEKRVRDTLLKAELRRERALESLDLANSAVWPPWLPGADRRMPLAQALTFNVVLRTKDGAPPPVRPEPEHLSLALSVDGEEVPAEKLDAQIVLRAAAPSRPDEMSYACHVKLHGDVLPRSRFLESATSLRADGAPVDATLRAALFGEPVGESVPVLLTPSRRLQRRVKMAQINASMQDALRKAREDAAREAGVELPPPSPAPPPTDYWRPLNPPLA